MADSVSPRSASPAGDPADWAEKYRPVTLKDIVGNKKALHETRLWADAWSAGIPEKRALIIHGPAGVGKTSAVHALAREMGWTPVELNASDQRTADAIEKVAGAASRMTSLFSDDGVFSKDKRKLIILDEADNLHGTYDRGGSRALADVIKKTDHPVILIANDVYGITQAIRGLAAEIPFGAVQSRSIVPAILKVCQAENIDCTPEAAAKIAENAGGDLRSAMNDLQAAAIGKVSLKAEDIVTSERDVKETIFKALVKVFKGSDRKAALDAIRSLDETPEDVILWVDENLPTQFAEKADPENPGVNRDIREGYETLVRADRYLGRVRRRQNYHLWRYAGFMMTVGPMAARTKDYPGFIKYESPTRWRRMGQNKSMRLMRDAIAVKIATRHKDAMRSARIRTIPAYMKLMKDEEMCIRLTAETGFDIDEMIYLLGAKSATKKIQALYEKAAECRVPEEPAVLAEAAAPKKKEDRNQKTLEEIIAEKQAADEKRAAEEKEKQAAEEKEKQAAEEKEKQAAAKAAGTASAQKEEPERKQKSLFDF